MSNSKNSATISTLKYINNNTKKNERKILELFVSNGWEVAPPDPITFQIINSNSK